MHNNTLAFTNAASTIGVIYIFIGIAGFICNITTLIMIASYRVYRLSAYTIMANLALADGIMLVVAGIICGLNMLQLSSTHQKALNSTVMVDEYENTHIIAAIAIGNNLSLSDEAIFRLNSDGLTKNLLKLSVFKHITTPNNGQLLPHPDASMQQNDLLQQQKSTPHFNILIFLLSFFQISAWTAGIISYAFLGINRCIAICFYRTGARSLNQVSFALIASTITWIIGIITACIGTIPEPLMGTRLDMWTISFLSTNGKRSRTFIILISILNLICLVTQWTCSTMVLMKIHKVRQKISRNKLNINSANKFKKQTRLTFQFFYPSLVCTISSILFFAKPFMIDILTHWQFIFLHLIWLSNHMCNPFIYAYFNERMRNSYLQWLTCLYIRQRTHKYRKRYWLMHGKRLHKSRRFDVGGPAIRIPLRRNRSSKNGHFVRSSLQMQSRDFEQLCEFMMRVNPANRSSEGWTDSESENDKIITYPFIKSSSSHLMSMINEQEHHHSLVYDLGRQTVAHWAKFARKASF